MNVVPRLHFLHSIHRRLTLQDGILHQPFQNNLKHNGSRYQVKLLFVCKNKTLLDNYMLAKTRTGYLLKQLAKDDALPKNYDPIFKDTYKRES